MSHQHYIFGQEDNMLPMLQIQIQKQRKKRVATAPYFVIYNALIFMSKENIPMSKYRITNRKAVLDLMISNKFIEECYDNNKVIIDGLHKDTKHYCVAPKGFEYMRAFEKLEGLFD